MEKIKITIIQTIIFVFEIIIQHFSPKKHFNYDLEISS